MTRRGPTTLVAPASDARKLAKAATLAASELVVDLEDAVAAGAQESARRSALAFLGSRERPRNVSVRVNSVRSSLGRTDLDALAAAPDPPGAVVLPKVEAPSDVWLAERILASSRRPIALQALIETAAGLAAVDAIAGAGGHLEGLIIGYEDLSASLGRAGVDELPELWLPAQHDVLVAARANSLRAIDGPTLELADTGVLTRACARARALGFDAKWAIHPAQLEPIGDALGATPTDLSRARAVLRALDSARAAGSSAASLDGRMIDTATEAWAHRVLGEVDR